jgi:hypothetical protein
MPDAGVHARRRLLILVGSPTHHPAGGRTTMTASSTEALEPDSNSVSQAVVTASRWRTGV